MAQNGAFVDLLGGDLLAKASDIDSVDLAEKGVAVTPTAQPGVISVPVFDVLSSEAEYVALLFSASYCPSCKKFSPFLEQAVNEYTFNVKGHRVQTVLVGGDRSEEAYLQYFADSKIQNLLAVPFSTASSVKDGLKARFQFKTIPHVVLLKRDTLQVVKNNVRFDLESDVQAKNFPWVERGSITGLSALSTDGSTPVDIVDKYSTKVNTLDSSISWQQKPMPFFSDPLFALGHSNVNPEKPYDMYMDENAVRVRAGILNVFSWFALINIFFWKEATLVWVLWPVVCWDMLSASIWGLTPLAPIGMLGTGIARLLAPHPHWKPAGPKRFAWAIGFFLVNACFISYQYEVRAGLIASVVMCNVATWLESSCGFCIGCWFWNSIIAPRMGKQACQECTM